MSQPDKSSSVGPQLNQGTALSVAAQLSYVVFLCLFTLLPRLSEAQTGVPPAVAQAYLYVEPYQARVEVLFDATSVLRWQAPETPLPASLDAGTQKGLTEKIARPAETWCQLQGDGKPLPGAFAGAAIIKGKPGNTLPFEEGAEIALSEAMVGLTWEFPTASAPQELTLSWQGFGPFPATAQLPVTVFFGTQSERLNLTGGQPEAAWQSQGRIPEIPPLTNVPPVPAGPAFAQTWLYAGLGLLGAGLLYFVLVGLMGWPLPSKGALIAVAWGVACLCIVGTMMSKSKPNSAVKTPDQAKAILSPLLRNVYRAFDHRAEGEIYDVLARSVSGDLLRTLYLETIQALTLEGREGTRVTISHFDAEVSAVHPVPSGFSADCQWTALGTVGHWGHTHTRVNRYTAKVTIAPEPEGEGKGRAWKITALEVTEARRL